MILSRTLARQRIAAGTRPGWIAAWAPVAIDALALVTVLALVFFATIGTINAFNLPLAVTIVIFFALFFVPIQIVLITASLWATRSRWVDDASDVKLSTSRKLHD